MSIKLEKHRSFYTYQLRFPKDLQVLDSDGKDSKSETYLTVESIQKCMPKKVELKSVDGVLKKNKM